MKIQESNILNFGLDYLEFKGNSHTIESISFWLWNMDCYIQHDSFPWFYIKKTTKVMNYEYKIIIRKNWYDCFAYHKLCINGWIETKDFISVYWVAFKIFKDIDEIFEFINTNIEEKLKLILELNANLYTSYKSASNEKKSLILKNLFLELFIDSKKELSYTENSLYNCLKLLNFNQNSKMEVPSGFEPL